MGQNQYQVVRHPEDGGDGHSGPGRPEVAENVTGNIQKVCHPGDEFETAPNKRTQVSGVKRLHGKGMTRAVFAAFFSVVFLAEAASAQDYYVRVEPLEPGESVSGSGVVQTCALREGGASTVNRTCITSDGLQRLADDVEELHDSTVGTGDLENGAVTNAKLSNNSVDSSKVVNNSLTASDLAADSVGSSELADNAVDTAAIQDGAVTEAKLADDSVTSEKIVNGTVRVEDLNDEVMDEVDRKDQETLTTAKTYADEGDKLTLRYAKSYTDQVGEKTYQRSKAYTDQQVGALRNDMNAMGDTLSDGIAIALAAKVPTLEGGANNALSVGLGNYNGSTALSIGGAVRLDANVVAYGTLGIASRTQKLGTSLGVMWSW